MHSVFRIEQVKRIDQNARLWQVDLTLTGDNDPQFHTLTKRMREETKGSTGWFRLGELMIKLGQFNKAEELYEILLQQTTTRMKKRFYFISLGKQKLVRENMPKRLDFMNKHEKSSKKTLPANHPDLAGSYNNIDSVNMDMPYVRIAIYRDILRMDDPLFFSFFFFSLTLSHSIYV
jgi:septum formation inhibitor MinC